MIGGFSQGGVLALLSALTCSNTFGGAVCLSGYLPMADKLSDFLQKADKLNIFIGHGIDDKPIDISLAQNTVDILQNNGFDVDFNTYPMEHTIYEDELNDVVTWLSRY